MKTSTVMALFAVQFLLCVIVTAGVFMFSRYQLVEARLQAKEWEAHGLALEAQKTALKEQLAAQTKFRDEQSKENARLNDKIRELDKQVADLRADAKTKLGAMTKLPFALDGGEPQLQLGEATKTLREQLLKQLGNIQTRPNGLGIAGSITINGDTLEFGDVKKLNGNVKNLLDELGRNLEPEKIEKPKAEKGDQF